MLSAVMYRVVVHRPFGREEFVDVLPQWLFGDFQLDQDNACLWRGAQAMALTPKAFAVLPYLVTHPDRLVTKDRLLDAVWPETAISDTVVRIAVGGAIASWPRDRG